VQLNGIHGVISQKMILFITTPVKTSNPTEYRMFVNRALKKIFGLKREK
jgi:hypothetical protein